MTLKSGLRYLFEATRQWFVDNVSTIVLALGAGTASVEWACTAAGYATGETIWVEFLTSGTVGTTGITYRVSTDDQKSWTDSIALGTATTISIDLPLGGGVLVISLSAGTVADGGTIQWTPQPTAFAFGELEPNRQDNLGPRRISRIVFVPGHGPLDGPRAFGDLLAPREHGEQPKCYGEHKAALQIFIWASDLERDALAEVQTDAVELLIIESLLPALYSIAGSWGRDGTIEYKSGVWLPVSTRPFGREVVMDWTVRIPVMEPEPTIAYPTLDDSDAALSMPVAEEA